jgi:hypothetical protein
MSMEIQDILEELGFELKFVTLPCYNIVRQRAR